MNNDFLITNVVYRGKNNNNEWVKRSLTDAEGIDLEPSTIGIYTGFGDYFTGDIIKSELDNKIGVICFGEYRSLRKKNIGNSKHTRMEYHIGIYIEWTGKAKDLLRQDFGYWAKKDYVHRIGNIFDNPELLKSENNKRKQQNNKRRQRMKHLVCTRSGNAYLVCTDNKYKAVRLLAEYLGLDTSVFQKIEDRLELDEYIELVNNSLITDEINCVMQANLVISYGTISSCSGITIIKEE